jgi:hypothetical protein
MHPESPRQPGILLLFLFLLACYCVTTYGFLSNADNESVFQTAKSIVENRTFALGQDPAAERIIKSEFTVHQGRDGRYYSWFGIFHATAWAPFYAGGQFLQSQVDWTSSLTSSANRELQIWPRLATTLSNAVITAWTGAVIASLLHRLGYRLQTALATGLIFGLGTIAWEYSRSAFGEPLVGLLLVLLLANLWRARQDRSLIHITGAGLVLGLLLLTRSVMGLMLIPTLVYLLLRKPASWRAWAAWLLPFGLGVFLFGLSNFVRFGDPLETGYGAFGSLSYFQYPLSLGIYGLLLSPGKGLLVYSPILLLALAGFGSFSHKHPNEAVFILLASSLVLAVYASTSGWVGGWAWGPRYVVPLIGLWMLPLASFVEQHWRRRALWLVVALCIAVQAFLLLAYYPAYLELATALGISAQRHYLGLTHLPILAQFQWAWHNLTGLGTRPLPEFQLNLQTHLAQPLRHFFWVWFPPARPLLLLPLGLLVASGLGLVSIFRRPTWTNPLRF